MTPEIIVTIGCSVIFVGLIVCVYGVAKMVGAF